MKALFLTLLIIFTSLFWIKPPPSVQGQAIRLPVATPIDSPILIERTEEVSDEFVEKAKLLNSKIDRAERNRKEIDQINSKALKQQVVVHKKADRPTYRSKTDTFVLVQDIDTVYFPDTILIEEPFVKGRTFWGRWWRAQVKLIKQCTLHRHTDHYYKKVRAKVIRHKDDSTSNADRQDNR